MSSKARIVTRPARTHCAGALSLALVAMILSPARVRGAQEALTGPEILSHPVGRAVLEAAALLHAGKLDQVRRSSDAFTRAEWSATSEHDRRQEALIAQERAPDPESFRPGMSGLGELTIYDDSAVFRWTLEDESAAVIAYATHEDGAWKVTGGPMVIQMSASDDSGPTITGAEILDHEIGRIVIAFAEIIATGDFEGAMELASDEMREEHRGMDRAERQASERYWQETLPAPAELEDQIRSSGQLYLDGDRATLVLSTATTRQNDDGSVSYSSSSASIPFQLVRETWRVAG